MTTATLTRPIKVCGADAPREEWLDYREAGITATDIAKIAGVHPYGSAIEVYYDKTGEPFDDTAGEAAEIGLILEEPVKRLWMKRTGLKVVKAGLYQSAEIPWVLATPDGLVLDGDRPATRWENIAGTYEGKTALGWTMLDWDDDGTVPDQYLFQVQWQLAATGLPRAWMAALAGPHLASYEVERDQELIDDLLAIGERFWEHNVLKRIPPQPDGSERLADLLKRRWQSDPRKVVTLDPDEFDRIKAAKDAAATDLKAAEAAKTQAENEMRLLLGEAEAGVLPGSDKPVVTWKESDRKGYTVQPGKVRTLRFK